MQFLLSVIDTATGSATSEEIAVITEFNNQLRSAGHWVFAGGLSAPSAAVIIDNREGTPVTTSGALHDSPTYLSGFWIIDAPNAEVAAELAAQASQACNRPVELRPLLG